MSAAKLICSYCKNYRLRDETTPVPKNGKLQKRWFRALGEKFEKDFQDDQRICLNHFLNVQNYRRAPNAIPRKLPFRNRNLGEKVKRAKRAARNEKKKTVVEVENKEVENRMEPEDMEVVEEVDNLVVGEEPEVNHLEPEEVIENEVDENEDPRMEEIAAARGSGKEHPRDEEEQPNQEEGMDCEVDENQLVVAVEEGSANVIERVPERIEEVHPMIPFKHCYMCGKFSEDQTPEPESLLRTYTCEECIWSPFCLRT